MLQLMRIYCEPATKLIENLIFLGSEDFDLEQAAIMARDLNDGGAGDPGIRRYRAQAAASLEAEVAALGKLDEIRAAEWVWSAIPSSSVTISFRALSFRMAQRLVCAVAFHRIKPAHNLRSQIFRAFGDQGAEDLLQEDLKRCEQLKDAWSADMILTGGIPSSPLWRAKLECLLLDMESCVTGVEARHALLRRAVMSRYHSSKISVPDIGCFWIAKQRGEHGALHRCELRSQRPPAKTVSMLDLVLDN